MYPIIRFFDYSIPTFGVLFLLGTGAAFLLGVYTARKYGITTMDAMFFGLFGIIGGISGAKILYIIVDLPNLLANPETARVRDVAEAPDGSIWFLSVGNGAAYRLAPAE